MRKFHVTIASLPDRERPVAEIAYENVQWVEISQETGEIIIQFYPHPRQKFWEFSFDDAIEILQRAKAELLNPKGFNNLKQSGIWATKNFRLESPVI